ncbi:MAG: SusC/RagA family TonB-linked outer membrane protein [Gelidibacter sp.]
MRMKFYYLSLLLSTLLFSTSVFAQERTISGIITDENNVPLAGATVIVQGTTTGVSADFDGNYTINAKVGDVLQFSYVGYASQSFTVGIATTLNVSMRPDNTLDEVVVTALGIKRKPDEISSSSQLVKGDNITQASNPDAVQALAGKVSGLQINTVSSGVNPNTQIILRGVKSISGANEALVVIDNIISSAAILSSLDPSVIESVNILKGAQGAALYGAKGGSGVIIVTTKKGTDKKGKLSIELNSSTTFEDIAYLPQMQDRYGKGYWGEIDAFDQGSWGPEFDGSLQPVGLPYPTVNDFRYETYEFRKDNIADFFQVGTTFQNGITFSGGDSDGYYTLTANTRNTEGLIPDDKLKRDFFSLNTGKTFGKLKLGAIARYTTTKSDVVSAYENDPDRIVTIADQIYFQLLQTPSNVDIRDFDSGDNHDSWTAFANSPYWVKENSRVATTQERTDLSADLTYDLNEHISFSLRPSIMNSNYRFVDFLNAFEQEYTVTGDARDITSNLEIETGSLRRIYVDAFASFNYDLGKNITFKSLIGFNSFEEAAYLHETYGRDLTIPGFYDVDNISSGIQVAEGKSKERSQAVFVNMDFGYKDYLFLNLTGRQDWSSRLFFNGAKIGDTGFFYPSAGLSFIPTRAFPEIQNDVLHKIKLGASYTKVGNVGALAPHRIVDSGTQAPGFPYTSTGANAFILPGNTTASGIEPEFVTTYEALMNLELFNIKGRPLVTLDASYSHYINENQLLNTTPSSTSGVTQALINVGETKTDAFELDLGLNPIKTEDWSWSANIGYSTSKTTVVKVTDDANSVVIRGGTPGIYAIEGEEFPVIQGSYYERDNQGRVIINEAGEPQVASGLKILGKVTPDYIINFSTNLNWKGFSLSATGDFRTGHSFYSNVYNNLTGQGRSFLTAENGRGYFIFPNSTVEGSGVTNTSVLTGPSYSSVSEYAAYQNFIQDGAFLGVDENFVIDATALKIREIALSYSLSGPVLDNLFLNEVVLGVSGRNLITVLPKENRGYHDPEIGNGLEQFSQTPPTKFYTLNVKLKF